MKFAKLESLQSVVLAIACAGGLAPYAFAADNNEAAKTSAASTIQAPLGDSFSIFDRVVDSSTKLSQASRQILSHLVIDISLLVCG